MITADFEYLKRILQEKAAIVLATGKEYLLETRLSPIAQQEGFGSLEELIKALRERPWNGLHQKVINAMTTNETLFFRDTHPFEALRKSIIPELVSKRAAERRITIWCMACSSGQEPYSIAMLLREHFPTLNAWAIFLLATDISDNMLEKTKQGIYGQLEVNRGLPASYLIKYFEKTGHDWQIKEPLRRMVGVQKVNLIEPWPLLPRMDVVFLRNVLIYFDVETKKKILAKVRQALKPDGTLFLGGSETTLNLDDHFERIILEKTVCYRLRNMA